MQPKNISPIVAEHILKNNKNIPLIDVRTKEEYEKEKHIKNSEQIDFEKIENVIKERYPDKNKQIILCCKTGVRSKEAAKKLMNIGYNNIYDMGSTEYWIYLKGGN